LLAALKTLEGDLGRIASFRWGPRAIDIDILDYAGVRRNDPVLTIPHARLFERAFVLVPLAEIDASYAAARDALPVADVAAVERIGAFEREGVQG
jgi:dihydroneopterin aldolase/2-amino-4-hydroxy-6-hydroxymethyldihydropteridine diphosphokinase